MYINRALIVFQNFDYFIKPSGLPFGYHDAVVSSLSSRVIPKAKICFSASKLSTRH